MKWIFAIAFAAVALMWGASVWVTAQPFVGRTTVALGAKADPARVERTVRGLVEQFPHRHGGNPQELVAAGSWLERQLNLLGVVTTRDTFEVRGSEHFNVLGSIGPQHGGRVIVGAHFDAHPETPGADDNASGVAAVVEVARILSSSSLPCSIELSFWTLEEPPFFRTADMGSAHHAGRLKREGADVRAMFSIEMLGFFRDQAGSQRYPPRFPASPIYPSAGNFALLLGDLGSTSLTRSLKAAFAGTSTLPVESINVSRSFAGADFSDHQSFWAAGYSAFMVTDSAFLRNPNYHRPTDTAETLDFTRLAAAADGIAAMAIAACSAP